MRDNIVGSESREELFKEGGGSLSTSINLKPFV